MLEGERDVFEFYVMRKEMELFEVLVAFDPNRTLVRGHVVCHSPESSASGDAAGFWEWLGDTRAPHQPSPFFLGGGCTRLVVRSGWVDRVSRE